MALAQSAVTRTASAPAMKECSNCRLWHALTEFHIKGRGRRRKECRFCYSLLRIDRNHGPMSLVPKVKVAAEPDATAGAFNNWRGRVDRRRPLTWRV